MCYSSDIPLFLLYTIPSTSKVDEYDYVLNKSFKYENWSFYGYHGVTQNIFLGGSSTKKCDHDCNQALIKSSWGSV